MDHFQKRNAWFKQRLEEQKIVLAPGIFDGLSAKLVQRAGAEVLYLSGSGIAASHGLPDVGLISFSEVLTRAQIVADVVDIPVIADGDTGFGNASNVVRAVRGFEQAGMCAIQLEDQTYPKRCGHFEGKSVIPLDEMLTKLYAALDVRRDPNFLIVARTDAHATHGFDEAINRGQAFVKAGADVVFIEAPQTLEEIQQIPQRIDARLMINLPEGGKTPLLPAQQLQEWGYDIVIHANMILRMAAHHMQRAAKHLLDTGDSSELLSELITFQDRDDITDLPALQSKEKHYQQQALDQLESSRKSQS